ncbi:MAG TPA: RnfABCDGE type electron transport complex subunit G [Candidatus Sumerlaeota bacterium]|nr:RnfABCDGE type electron transport complex subunit G [Candidatus Sumerlaeota bacterium]
MPKKQFSDTSIFLTLTVVSLGAAAVLAATFHVTEKPIQLAEKQKKEDALKIVLPPDTDTIESVETSWNNQKIPVDLARNKDGAVAGYAVETTSSNGYGGDIVFQIGFDASGSVITYMVMEHTETPGLGENICGDVFRKQFNGKNLQNFKFAVTKDGGDVEAITAATISSRAASEALKQGAEIIDAFRKANP